MSPIKIASFMSEISHPFCRAVADYLATTLDTSVHFINDTLSDNLSETLLTPEQLDVAWVCGLQYVRQAKNRAWGFAPCVAPCLMDESPPHQPIYYAEVIVHQDSPHPNFTSLRQTAWAYNEQASFSGFEMVRTHFAELGQRSPRLGQAIPSGSHLNSIELVRQRTVEWAAIDSTVLRLARAETPSLQQSVRVIERLGPYPMPPWIVSDRLPASLRQAIKKALLTMHGTVSGLTILQHGGMTQFLAVNDADYDPIRQAVSQAERVTLPID